MIPHPKKGEKSSDKWFTPPEILDPLQAEFDFNHDPCPRDWQPGDPDALTTEWGDRSFCNPPYSLTGKFIKKAHDEWKKGKLVVMLINAVTETRAFHDYILGKAEIRFIKGRVKFINPDRPDVKSPAPRPSIIVVFRPADNPVAET